MRTGEVYLAKLRFWLHLMVQMRNVLGAVFAGDVAFGARERPGTTPSRGTSAPRGDMESVKQVPNVHVAECVTGGSFDLRMSASS